MLDRGLPRRFDPLVEREARDAAERVAGDVSGRLDLRDLPTFTIDPPTARDFDDAISAELLDDGAVRVWVHIADVSAHVQPGSHVDREAFRRGDVGLRARRGRADAAGGALQPGVLARARPGPPGGDGRDGAGRRQAAPHHVPPQRDPLRQAADATRRSTRSSPARERAEEPWAAPLAAARRAADALQAAREAQGALEVESEEPEFAFSREGHVTALVPSEQTESHRLIEHLMIAANEAVATLLESRKLPALYRVHERPEPARVQRLVEQLASLDIPTPPLPETMTPQQAADAVAEIARVVAKEVRRRDGHGRLAFTSLVLRSLKQAHYSPKNVGHAGLRSHAYCHFTSPIRRYPDLVCHRALLSAIGAGEEPPAASRLDAAAEWCSERERAAMSIERAADSVARCFLLEAELFVRGWDTEFAGEVTGVIGAGAFVAFGDGYEGHAAGPQAARRLVGARRARDDARRRPERQRDPARRPGDRAGHARRHGARPRRPVTG